jgi:hypothetical protein
VSLRVARLIVSHIGLFDLDAAIADPRNFYTGPLTVGTDCNARRWSGHRKADLLRTSAVGLKADIGRSKLAY